VAETIRSPLLAAELSKRLGRVAIDRTGIPGRYDAVLTWLTWSSGDRTSAPPIFTAIEEQLGLKLESQRGPVQVLVIDTVEMPSAH
jgi:uncharacterized protein (TIGR03435 family)